MWEKVCAKMRRVPNNGYLEVWLQRVIKPTALGIEYESDEPICKIVTGEPSDLWNNDWIGSSKLKEAMDASKILVKNAADTPEVMTSEEVELFKKNAWQY